MCCKGALKSVEDMKEENGTVRNAQRIGDVWVDNWDGLRSGTSNTVKSGISKSGISTKSTMLSQLGYITTSTMLRASVYIIYHMWVSTPTCHVCFTLLEARLHIAFQFWIRLWNMKSHYVCQFDRLYEYLKGGGLFLPRRCDRKQMCHLVCVLCHRMSCRQINEHNMWMTLTKDNAKNSL